MTVPPPWDTYPANYRADEIARVLRAVSAGECVSIIGLSGAGKSNLVGFLAYRVSWAGRFVLVDGNRLLEPTPNGYLELLLQCLGTPNPAGSFEDLLAAVDIALVNAPAGLCLLLDRFDALPIAGHLPISRMLRALRDTFKYRLSLVFATRRPLDPTTELGELVAGNTLWLGPLSHSNALWSAGQYAQRRSLEWPEAALDTLYQFSGGYPSLLRAACEAYASLDHTTPPDPATLQNHPAVVRRVEEFWADQPTPNMLKSSGLEDHPLLQPPSGRTVPLPTEAPAPPEDHTFDTTAFTAKEMLLYETLRAHAGAVCEKDFLVQAIWPEDVIYEQGVRDDSLAQLVRRLRKKIEPAPANPTHIHTVPGRGYLWRD